jgi:anti-sigma regulatory factor (Ser/Thr protein kinase)
MEDNNFTAPNLPARVEAERSHLRLPSLPEWIEPTAEYLKNKALFCGACLEADCMKLTIALHEALSNAVVHGNLEISSELKEQGETTFAEALAARSSDPRYFGRAVDVLMDYEGERCQWTLTDEGKCFDVQRILARDPRAEDMLLKASGRGILMMKAFLDEVRYEAGGRRIILSLRKPAGQEKRRHARQPITQRLRIAPLRQDGSVDWESAYDAVSRNYSLEGIAFFQERLAVSDRIIIGIDSEGGPLYLPAEVRHWRTLDGGVVELGCRFPSKTAEMPDTVPTAPGSNMEKAIDSLLEQFQVEQVPRPIGGSIAASFTPNGSKSGTRTAGRPTLALAATCPVGAWPLSPPTRWLLDLPT